jgi:hypothetical protein
VLISGKVLNDRTNEPVAAKIFVEELPSGKEVAIARTDPKTGEFKIILPAGKKYGFRAVAEGFFEINKNIDLTDVTEYEEIEDEVMRIISESFMNSDAYLQENNRQNGSRPEAGRRDSDGAAFHKRRSKRRQ